MFFDDCVFMNIIELVDFVFVVWCDWDFVVI